MSARPTFLFPVRALSRAFAHRFLTRLEAAGRQQRLVWPEPLATVRVPSAFRAWLDTLRQKAWGVYAESPCGGPATVLDYLERYTHRVAISNRRLTAVAEGHVSFTYRDRQQGGVVRELTLSADAFIRRFLPHVLPPHFVRIRHLAYLANRAKTARLAQGRRLLDAAPPPPVVTPTTAEQVGTLTGVDSVTCPHCHTGPMILIEHWPRGSGPAGHRAAPPVEDSS